MPRWTSAAVAAPRLPEVTPKERPSRPWVIALVTIIAVSTSVAAIGVLAACVVLVQTVEMTDWLARQTVLNLAVAGSLVQISILSFMFVREKYQHGELRAQLVSTVARHVVRERR